MCLKWSRHFKTVNRNIGEFLYKVDVLVLCLTNIAFIFINQHHDGYRTAVRNQDNSPTRQLTDTVFETIHRQILRQLTDTL